MANESFQEKTERATPKRRDEARRKGNVAKSVEINSAAVLLTGILMLFVMGRWMLTQMMGIVRLVFKELCSFEFTVESTHRLVIDGLVVVTKIVAPIMLAIMVVGVLVNYVQVGLLFTLEPLMPNLNSLNPISGFKRLLSTKSLVELIKSVLKIIVVGSIAYVTLKRESEQVLPLMDYEVGQIFSYICSVTFKLALRIVLVLVILAALDYVFQKWDYERNLKMTKEEVKEEYKQAEGDPKIKGKIRAIQREMARRRMLKALPEADVVITNPIHLAIALKYDSQTMSAPTVIAKGARWIAEKIKQIAEDHDIPIVEDKALAQALYKSVEIGMEIPPQFYRAVAEILSYVFRLKNKKVV